MGGAGPEGVTYDLATGLLGFTPDTLLDEVVDAFAAGDGGTVFGVVDKVIETGQDPRRFTEDLLRRLRDLVIIAAVPDAPATGLIDVPQDQGERLTAQAARFGRADLSRSAELVADGAHRAQGRDRAAAAARADLRPGAAARRRPRHRGHAWPASTGSRSGCRSRAPRAPPLPPRRPAPPPPSRSGRARRPSPPPAPADARSPAGPPPSAPSSRPAAAEPADPSRAEPEPAPEPAAAPAPEPRPRRRRRAGTGTSTGLGLVDVRRLWPDLLDAVKLKRRFTWILLSQNAQVAAVDDKTLTIALINAGARNSFSSGGSEEILRQAAIDVIGHDWRIEAIVDPSAQPGAEPPITVTRPPCPSAAAGAGQAAGRCRSRRPGRPRRSRRPSGRVDPESIAAARGAIQDTRPAGDAAPAPAPTSSDEDADRDDPDADDHSLGGAQLLERELGASIIEEIKHD